MNRLINYLLLDKSPEEVYLLLINNYTELVQQYQAANVWFYLIMSMFLLSSLYILGLASKFCHDEGKIFVFGIAIFPFVFLCISLCQLTENLQSPNYVLMREILFQHSVRETHRLALSGGNE